MTKSFLDWNQAWERFKIPFCLGVVGLVLVGLGIFSLVWFMPREPQIEIIPAEETQAAETIFIDLSGAVEKPGFYELPFDARINDLLIKAGGLSAEADREWVEKNLNLAQKLADGTKLYIPRQNEIKTGGEVAGMTADLTGKINLNTATKAELDTLWGIGEARAEAIIQGRPYDSVETLKTEKIIPSNVFETIKEKICVY